MSEIPQPTELPLEKTLGFCIEGQMSCPWGGTRAGLNLQYFYVEDDWKLYYYTGEAKGVEFSYIYGVNYGIAPPHTGSENYKGDFVDFGGSFKNIGLSYWQSPNAFEEDHNYKGIMFSKSRGPLPFSASGGNTFYTEIPLDFLNPEYYSEEE